MNNTDRRFAQLIHRLTQILVWEFESLRATTKEASPTPMRDTPQTPSSRKRHPQNRQQSRFR